MMRNQAKVGPYVRSCCLTTGAPAVTTTSSSRDFTIDVNRLDIG